MCFQQQGYCFHPLQTQPLTLLVSCFAKGLKLLQRYFSVVIQVNLMESFRKFDFTVFCNILHPSDKFVLLDVTTFVPVHTLVKMYNQFGPLIRVSLIKNFLEVTELHEMLARIFGVFLIVSRIIFHPLAGTASASH